MISDPTDEIRAIKRKLAAECGNDIHRIAEDARRRQQKSGRNSVSVPYSTGESTTHKGLQPSGK